MVQSALLSWVPLLLKIVKGVCCGCAWVKLPLAVLASPIRVLVPSLLPVCAPGNAVDDSQVLGFCTNVKSQEGIPGSCFGPGLKLAVVTIWGINQWVEDPLHPLSLCLTNE